MGAQTLPTQQTGSKNFTRGVTKGALHCFNVHQERGVGWGVKSRNNKRWSRLEEKTSNRPVFWAPPARQGPGQTHPEKKKKKVTFCRTIRLTSGGGRLRNGNRP